MREVASQGGAVDDKADSLANDKVECGRLILPDGNRDCGEPFMEWLGGRGVGVLGDDRTDLTLDGGFPLCMKGGVE
jgi:hypothetical protein